MTQPEQMLARILNSGARALAGYAVGNSPPLETGGSPGSETVQFESWQNVLVARLEELAVAISTGRPEYFVDQIHWAQTALKARGIPSETLREKLEALRRVLAEQIPADLAAMATDYVDRALAEFEGEPVELEQRLTAETVENRLAAEYLLAILEGDRHLASRLILKAADEGQSVTSLYLKVLQPAQEELGRMWVLGEINVAEEHFATATTRLVMAQLLTKAVCAPANGKTLLAAAVAGNQHDLGIQTVADLFEMDGWRVIQMGANVPAEDLAQAVEFYQADLVALSVSLATQLPALSRAIAAIRASERGAIVKVLAGGGGIAKHEEIAKTFGADAYAEDALQAVARGNCACRTATQALIEQGPKRNCPWSARGTLTSAGARDGRP